MENMDFQFKGVVFGKHAYQPHNFQASLLGFYPSFMEFPIQSNIQSAQIRILYSDIVSIRILSPLQNNQRIAIMFKLNDFIVSDLQRKWIQLEQRLSRKEAEKEALLPRESKELLSWLCFDLNAMADNKTWFCLHQIFYEISEIQKLRMVNGLCMLEEKCNRCGRDCMQLHGSFVCYETSEFFNNVIKQASLNLCVVDEGPIFKPIQSQAKQKKTSNDNSVDFWIIDDDISDDYPLLPAAADNSNSWKITINNQSFTFTNERLKQLSHAGTWLSATEIIAYSNRIFFSLCVSHRMKVKLYPTTFFDICESNNRKYLFNEETKQSIIKKYFSSTKKSRRQYFFSKKTSHLIIPAFQNNHWFLILVIFPWRALRYFNGKTTDERNPKIIVFDSKQERYVKNIPDCIKTLLACVYEDSQGEDDELPWGFFDPFLFDVITPGGVPQQSDESSCGLLLLKNFEMLCKTYDWDDNLPNSRKMWENFPSAQQIRHDFCKMMETDKKFTEKFCNS